MISRLFPYDKTVLDINCRERHNRHFVLSNYIFENRAVCEIMWENIVEVGRTQMVIWRVRIACWIRKATGRAVAYTTLQTGRSRVRFPMVSLEFFIDIILPAALWPWS